MRESTAVSANLLACCDGIINDGVLVIRSLDSTGAPKPTTCSRLEYYAMQLQVSLHKVFAVACFPAVGGAGTCQTACSFLVRTAYF